MTGLNVGKGGWDAEHYRNIEPEIIRSNKRNVAVIALVAIIMLTILHVLPFAVPQLQETIGYAVKIYAIGDAVSVLALAGIMILSHRYPKVVMPITYMYILVILAFGIAMSVLDTPDVTTTIFIVLLIIVPQLFITKPIFQNGIMIVSSTVFIALARSAKYEDIFITDLINTICFCVFGMIAGTYMSYIKIGKLQAEYENRLLLKREEERHKEKIEEQLMEIKALSEEQRIQLDEITQLNGQIQAALESAERANAAKTSFLSRMSHDIRTPLNGIIGLLELSERHAEDVAFLKESREKQMVAAKHLLALIGDVLDLTKMDDPNVVLSHEAFDVVQLTEDVLTISEARAAEAGITLLYQDCSDQFACRYVYGSPLHVRQIALNILSNAIKYNKPGGQVTCEVWSNDVVDGQVTFGCRISDTGIGMSKEFLEHLFEPFTQEHYDARSVYQGTGLGMAIVKTIIEKMNGTISVESEVGIGTTFTFTIPFEVAEKAENTQEKEHSSDINGCRILLAEDNELNREIVCELLGDCGAVVEQAVDGQKALEMFTQNPPGTYDVILMDLMMPVMDGITATRSIRMLEREDAQTIPIIAMTANAFAEDAIRCKEAGMNDHIAKPLDTPKLIRMIADYRQKAF